MARIGMVCVISLMVASVHRSTGDLLKPCGAVGEDERIRDSEKWFKWGQLYSYCTHKYLNSSLARNSSSSLCNDSIECTQCISICDQKLKSRKCNDSCVNEPCHNGCQFYNYLLTGKGNFTLHKNNLPRPNSTVIETASTHGNVSYSWEHVKSNGDEKIGSLYLLTLLQNKEPYEHIMGLVSVPKFTATSIVLCEKMYDFHYQRYKKQNLRFSLKAYAINFNGPANVKEAGERHVILTSEYVHPTKVPPLHDDLIVESGYPLFAYHNKESGEIMWKLNNSRSSHISYVYDLHSCPGDTRPIIEANFGIFRKYRFNNKDDPDGAITMRVRDPIQDTLADCKLKLMMSVQYGACFLSDPYTKIIQYTNCTGVSNYTNVCPYVPPTKPPKPVDTFVKNITLDLSERECTDIYEELCNPNSTSTEICEHCNNTMFTVNAVWLPYSKFQVYSYTLRYRFELDKRYTVVHNLTKETTSHAINIELGGGYNQLKLCVQIHAETSNSKDESVPVYMKWFETKILLRAVPIARKPISRSPISSKTVIVTSIAVVVVIAAVCVFVKLYCDRLQRRNKAALIENGGIYWKDSKAEITVIADEWEIYPESIDVRKKVGEGAFGTVYSARIDMNVISRSNFGKQCGGVALVSEKSKLVAVKFLKEGAGEEENKDFMDEIVLMKGVGYHRNIVNMIGCSTIKQPLCLIVEYMHNGDLLNYMRKQRSKQLNNQSEDPTEGDISLNDMMSFAWQIACGMEYLATKNMVHRDLAARNVLVSSDKRAKISDFGLSRRVTDELIYTSKSNRKIPVKWMSIEAIYHKEFTVQSDVWAYGVVLFEIVTLGGAPYPFISNLELCKMLKSGYRMERPENCSVEMHDIMCHCWNEIPARRPTFTELREHLEKIMEKGARYFTFDIDHNKAYYNVASFKSIPSDDEEEETPFTKEHDEIPIQVKAIDTVSVPVEEPLQEKLDSTDGNEGHAQARYISPHSLKSFTDIEKSVSCDNPGFHFQE